MFKIDGIEDIQLLRETATLECKAAQGPDGQGKLPKDFWPTYCAFANTYGGVVLLGVKEKRGSFEIVGLSDVEKVRKELFNDLNNKQKVSANLLSDADVLELNLDGKSIIQIDIPRASRRQKPVHITANPLSGNTYRRVNEADVSLPDEDVRRLLAEQTNDSRDSRVLRNFGFDDLSEDTFQAYRQVFASRDPGHPWNAQDNLGFLRSIGGWRLDRETGEGGLTVAGLLMFGMLRSIQDEFPNFMLDYQERPEAKTEKRWVDRLTLDGKWSGNLYDFYRRVYLKLTSDLKVPFALDGDERQDETGVHVALREALANALVHSDFAGRASVLIVKRPDMFGFRNPGLMRIPIRVALKGGESDCRNRILHQMFRFVGVGEQAGSGIPKILQGWEAQHWNPPKLHENSEPYDQTLLELRMIDLFPEKTLDYLRHRFGAKFDQLEQAGRVALALASSEGTVNHARLCTLSTEHPNDLSRLLHKLVQDEFLQTAGAGRGVVYFLPGQNMPTPEDIFALPSSSNVLEAVHSNVRSLASNISSSSSYKDGDDNIGSVRDDDGYLQSDQLDMPVIDTLDNLSAVVLEELFTLAKEPRTKARLSKEVMEEVILNVCDGHFITLQSLATLLDRSSDALRNQYLTPMVRDHRLSLAFPRTPTHERQAYCSASSIPSGKPNK